MAPQKLRFALEQLQPNQWGRFELFASAFLAAELPNLRTVAGSGDGGRDAELYEPSDDPTTKIQYSVAVDWSSKIKSTAKDLADNFAGTSQLIYATNQKIGPNADEVKKAVRTTYNLFVDVRDREWFVERYTLDAGRAAAAEALVQEIAGPILADKGLVERKATALSSSESRAACVHLALQYRDDSRDKGLTKLCFEALVRAVLRHSTPSDRMSRAEVRSRVRELLPTTPHDRSDVLTDAALGRLDRHAIRRWSREDEFCLSNDERSRIAEAVAGFELDEMELLEAIDWEVGRTHEAFGVLIPSDIRRLSLCARTAIESVLLQQGEAFAAAVAVGKPVEARGPDVFLATTRAMSTCELEAKHNGGRTANILSATVRVILTEPAEPVQKYLRAFADAYTLFAFLRETSDVQTAIVKMFSVGEIWLDTTVVLPLLAETLVEDDTRRRFTNMFRAAVECGLTLRITEGVLEEVESHTWNAILYAQRPNEWVSRVPFLAATYALAGNALSGFSSWVELFRGRRTPVEDLAEYLSEEHGIALGSLDADANKASSALRAAVQEFWQSVHERRRSDAATTSRLAQHDLENYLGVIERRRSEDRSHVGYRTWWLTLDKNAYEARQSLYKQFGRETPDSPVMSPDFMLSYLTIGPLRAQLSKSDELKLPLSVADLGPGEDLPRELIEQAEELRATMHDQDDRVVRRTLRERNDLARRRFGERARGGMGLVQRELETDLKKRR